MEQQFNQISQYFLNYFLHTFYPLHRGITHSSIIYYEHYTGTD